MEAMMRRREALAGLTLLAIGLAPIGCAAGSGGALAAGDFTVEGTDGTEYHLSDYRGKVVMVVFFASFDQRSRALLVQLSDVQKRYAERGLMVLPLAVDGPGTTAQVKQIARSRNIDLPIAIDADTSVVAHYNPKKIVPYAVFFGRDGKVIDRWLGHDRNDLKPLEERITTFLE